MELILEKCPKCGKPIVTEDKVIQYTDAYTLERKLTVMHPDSAICSITLHFDLLWGKDYPD